jgi:hypothetical protein
MEIKIVENAPINNLPSVAQDLKNMLVILFNERNIEDDALFLDKERVFKNRKYEHPFFPNETEIKNALNAIRTNCVRFCKEISSNHSVTMRSAFDKEGHFEGVYIKFKTTGDK